MPSASEIYLQKKAEQERLAREAEARTKAKEQFKAIMIFIDKKNLMPIGEENE